MLLRAALDVVGTHGFTRTALALSVTQLPPPHTHAAPLSDAAVSALFGPGSKAEHSLINFFFDEGIRHMRTRAQALATSQDRPPTAKEILVERLKFNEPVLPHLSSAFASLASGHAPKLGPFQLPPMLDPSPALNHALRIADEVCYLSGDTSTEVLKSSMD
jgi:ubiquinone biosynthesis protein COQ9